MALAKCFDKETGKITNCDGAINYFSDVTSVINDNLAHYKRDKYLLRKSLERAIAITRKIREEYGKELEEAKISIDGLSDRVSEIETWRLEKDRKDTEQDTRLDVHDEQIAAMVEEMKEHEEQIVKLQDKDKIKSLDILLQGALALTPTFRAWGGGIGLEFLADDPFKVHPEIDILIGTDIADDNEVHLFIAGALSAMFTFRSYFKPGIQLFFLSQEPFRKMEDSHKTFYSAGFGLVLRFTFPHDWAVRGYVSASGGMSLHNYWRRVGLTEYSNTFAMGVALLIVTGVSFY
jgi:hypothetical protein